MKIIGIILCIIGGLGSAFMFVGLIGTLAEGQRVIGWDENLREITNTEKMLNLLMWVAPLSLVFFGIGGFMIKKSRETEEKQFSEKGKDDLLEKF